MVDRGDEVTLEIEKFADQGKSLARVNGLVVFVPQAVPGDRVRAKVYKRKKSYAEAKVIDLIEPSDRRTDPRCYYFGTCGGCSWQHVVYEEQLKMKEQSVREALEHQGGFDSGVLSTVELRPIVGAERPYFYRNKMAFNFSNYRWLTPEEIDTGKDFDTDFALGLHVPGNFYKVLDLKECHLQSALSRRLVNGVRSFVKERGWKPWDIRRHDGFLRHLVIRQSERTEDTMANLVTSRYDEGRMEALGGWLREEFPEVTTLVNTINDTPAQTERGEEHHVIFGTGTIREELGGRSFTIGPETFFQTNTLQAERLFEQVRAMAEFRSTDTLYDLYCGAGALSLVMADRVEQVIGIEQAGEAVENARRNAEANGIENSVFQEGALRDVLVPAFAEKHGRPDVLLADPPRAGMHKNVIRKIKKLRPGRMVYVSCNPQTQARDLGRLKDAYRLEVVQPVDMFPQTPHVENIVALRAS